MLQLKTHLYTADLLMKIMHTNKIMLHLTVSEESSYSSDNTEPEDDCRGCQLQWHNQTKGKGLFPPCELFNGAWTSPHKTKTSLRYPSLTLESFRDNKGFRWVGLESETFKTSSSCQTGEEMFCFERPELKNTPRACEHVHRSQLLLISVNLYSVRTDQLCMTCCKKRAKSKPKKLHVKKETKTAMSSQIWGWDHMSLASVGRLFPLMSISLNQKGLTSKRKKVKWKEAT